ncbi:MAG: radical SAM protein [Elusimicrobiota bacterium]
MGKDRFYLESKDFDKEMFHIVDQIRFEWNMIYSCNYDCRYCVFYGKWKEYAKRNVILSPDQWVKHWQRIYGICGRVSMVISGGEPFIYPDFNEVIRLVSDIHYPIHISTNGSGDLIESQGRLYPQYVWVFQYDKPDYLTKEQMKEKLGRIFSGSKETIYVLHNVEYHPTNILAGYLKEYIAEGKAKAETLKVIRNKVGEEIFRVYSITEQSAS